MANRDFIGNYQKNDMLSKNDTSGFGAFLQSLSPALSAVGTAISPALGIGLNIGANALGSWFQNRVVNNHLTGKEREQNAWNAEQAQLNRDFQQQMSDTSYQRGVADMQAAGINPALAMGQGGASTPTGSNAQGSASLSSPMDVISMAMQMKYMEAQISNLDSQTDKNKAEAGFTRQSTENAKLTYDLTRKNIEGVDWDNKTKEIAYSFAKDTYDVRVEREGLTTEQQRKINAELDEKISNLSVERQKMLQEITNLGQQYHNLVAQEYLDYAHAHEAEHMLGQIDAMAEKLTQEGDLTKKDVYWYMWNHGSEVSGFGIKPGTRYFPASNKEIKHKL